MPLPKRPVLKIRFMKPGEVRKLKRQKLTAEEIGIKSDLSQFYAMKACIERILGNPLYLKVKDYAPITEWRKVTIRLLDAIELAISSTVHIADQQWRENVSEAVGRGRDLIKRSETISALFAVLSATLTEIVFLQLGSAPSRPNQAKTAPLTAEYWTLDRYRSVQYVQTDTQKRAVSELVKSPKTRSE